MAAARREISHRRTLHHQHTRCVPSCHVKGRWWRSGGGCSSSSKGKVLGFWLSTTCWGWQQPQNTLTELHKTVYHVKNSTSPTFESPYQTEQLNVCHNTQQNHPIQPLMKQIWCAWKGASLL